MAQIQVNLEGVPVVVENRRVPLESLKLDAQNPRIGLYQDSQPKPALSDEEIRHAIVNRSPDAYTKLRDSIEINEGVINPIWIAAATNGKHLVIEGNTRVLIYRELAEKYRNKETWKSIAANVLPVGIRDSQINFIRLEAHLRGVTEWDAYRNTPTYAIITPSRGCPYNCHYCAAKTINNGIQQVRFRSVDDIFAEMCDKYGRFGIRDFAFYADFLLIRYEDNLMPLLRKIVAAKMPWRLYAPEGLDTRFLASSQELCDLLKAAHFQKLYLPVENVDDDILVSLNRKHVKLKHVVEAAKNVEKAGFKLRHLEVNGYCLYGLPGENISNVVQTALFVSDVIGSVIPMLFAPVPSTQLFNKYLDYYKQRGWCDETGMVRDLHLLNGKLFPFLQMNEGSVEDYIDLQRVMFMLNQNYRSKSFSLFGDGAVSKSFRQVIGSFKTAETEQTLINGQRVEAITRMASDLEFAGMPSARRA